MADDRLNENGFNEKEVELMENNLNKAKEGTKYSGDEKFNRIYKNIIEKYGEELETMRTATVDYSKGALILVIVGIVFAFSIFLIWASVICWILAYNLKNKSKGRKLVSRSDYKDKFYSVTVDEIKKELNQPNIDYIKIDKQTSDYNNAEFEKYDVYVQSGAFGGTLNNGCEYTLFDVLTKKEHVTEETDSNGNKTEKTTYTTLFDGCFCRLKLPKSIDFNFYLRHDTHEKSSSKSTGPANKEKLRVQLDSSEFEEEYDVYSNDQIKTFQFLTSNMMETMTQIKDNLGVRIELTLKKDMLYIRFHNIDVFAMNSQNSLDERVIYDLYKISSFSIELSNLILNQLENNSIAD